MISKNSLLLILSPVLVFNLMACSAKVSGGSGGDPAPDLSVLDKDFSNKVAGPSLDGDWASECVPGSMGGQRRVYLKVQGQNFEHKEVRFTDSDCHQVLDKKELKGQLRFTKEQGRSIYTVQYKIPVDANSWTWQYRNFSVNGDTMMITDFAINESDLGGKVPSIELVKRGPATVTPVIVPGSAPAPASKEIVLENTEYAAYSGKDVCNVSINVGTVAGKMAKLAMEPWTPCRGARYDFDCDGNVCKNPEYSMVITAIDSTTFELSYTNSTEKSVMKKVSDR